MNFDMNEKYVDRIKKAAHYYDDEDLAEWKRWAEKWASLGWKDPKDS